VHLRHVQRVYLPKLTWPLMDGHRCDAAVKALGSAFTRRRMLRGCSPERAVVSSLTLRDSAPSKRVRTDHARGKTCTAPCLGGSVGRAAPPLRGAKWHCGVLGWLGGWAVPRPPPFRGRPSLPWWQEGPCGWWRPPNQFAVYPAPQTLYVSDLETSASSNPRLP
jgi:hypothetical protein